MFGSILPLLRANCPIVGLDYLPAQQMSVLKSLLTEFREANIDTFHPKFLYWSHALGWEKIVQDKEGNVVSREIDPEQDPAIAEFAKQGEQIHPAKALGTVMNYSGEAVFIMNGFLSFCDDKRVAALLERAWQGLTRRECKTPEASGK